MRILSHLDSNDASGIARNQRSVDSRFADRIQLYTHEPICGRRDDKALVGTALEGHGNRVGDKQAGCSRLKLNAFVHVDGLAGIGIQVRVHHGEEALDVDVESKWAVGGRGRIRQVGAIAFDDDALEQVGEGAGCPLCSSIQRIKNNRWVQRAAFRFEAGVRQRIEHNRVDDAVLVSVNHGDTPFLAIVEPLSPVFPELSEKMGDVNLAAFAPSGIGGDGETARFGSDIFDRFLDFVAMRVDDRDVIRREICHIQLLPIRRHGATERLCADLYRVDDGPTSRVDDRNRAAGHVRDKYLPIVRRNGHAARLIADRYLCNFCIDVPPDLEDRNGVVFRVDDPDEAIVVGDGDRAGVCRKQVLVGRALRRFLQQCSACEPCRACQGSHDETKKECPTELSHRPSS